VWLHFAHRRCLVYKLLRSRFLERIHFLDGDVGAPPLALIDEAVRALANLFALLQLRRFDNEALVDATAARTRLYAI
jgi:hypothetical protein